MRISVFFGIAALAATPPAWAQFGLYGAPDTLRLPAAQPAVATPVYQPMVNYPTQPPAAYPAPATPPVVYQPAPAYPAQPPVAYPAQPRVAYATTAYPPAPARPVATAPMYPAGATMQPARMYARPAVPMLAEGPAPAAAGPTPALVEPPETQPVTPAPATAVPAVQPAPIPIPAPGPAVSPSPSDRPNLMNNMLSQPPCACNGYSGMTTYGADGGYNGGACQNSVYGYGVYDQVMAGNCYAAPSQAGYVNPWYASVSVLTMGRDRPNGIWLGYRSNDLSAQECLTSRLDAAWQWGGEVTFGRRFCCDQWAVQGTYWTLAPTTAISNCFAQSGVYQISTPLNTSFTYFGDNSDPNNLIGNWFNGADQYSLCRRDEYHNVEVNFLRTTRCNTGCDTCGDACGAYGGAYAGTCGSACRAPVFGVDWLMGFRFFRFDEGLKWAALRQGGSWNDGADFGELNEHVVNNLWGFQVGANADLRLGSCVRIFCNPRIGIYDNHIEQNFSLFRGDGVSASGAQGSYPVCNSVDKIAFLSEVSLGVDWQFAPCWSARVGYRVVAGTGLALADDQIPFYLVDVPEVGRIGGNGSLILHGAFAGITYNF